MDPNKYFSLGQRISIGQCLFIVRHVGLTDNIMILEEISGENGWQGDKQDEEQPERGNRD